MSNRVTLDQLPKRYQDQVAAEMAKHPPRKPAASQPIPEPPPEQQKPATANGGGKARLRQERGGLNKTETAFLLYLRSSGQDSEIKREGLGIRLANGCVYWPDFVSLRDEGFCFWEVKGFAREDAIVKVKVAASLFPTFSFFLVTKRTKKQGGGWSIERVHS